MRAVSDASWTYSGPPSGTVVRRATASRCCRMSDSRVGRAGPGGTSPVESMVASRVGSVTVVCSRRDDTSGGGGEPVYPRVVTAARREPDRRTLVSSGSPYEATIGFSRAVRVAGRVAVAGTAPIWPDGSCDPDPAAQTRRCLEIILEALGAAGARPDDVIRTRIYITDAADADAVGRAHGETFAAIRPASTMVIVAGLLDPRWKVEVEAEAVIA